MKRLSIETLFTTPDGHKPYVNGKLDIKTLFGRKYNENHHSDFDSRELLKTVYKKRKKLELCYENIYDMCCQKIVTANNLGLTDIFFNVNYLVPDCPEYEPYECIEHIIKKLREQHLNVTVISERTLFISWIKLEKNIKSSSDENIQNNDNKNTN